jgi:precorrin-6B methylase 2
MGAGIKVNQETRAFIQDHLQDDLPRLMLLKKRVPEIDYPFAYQQIASRQKAEKKLPFWYSREDLIFPAPLSVEQASSEKSAQYKANLFSGEHLIDLSAGFGVDAFWLSSRFNRLTCVEPNQELCEILEHNFKALNVPNFNIHHTDAEEFIKKFTPEKRENITFYIDPDRRSVQGSKLVLLEDCSPNILDLYFDLIKKGGKVIVKLSPMIDLKQLMNRLPGLAVVYIISVKNECKEVVIQLEDRPKQPSIPIFTVNITDSAPISFNFNSDEEENCSSTFADQVGQYIYEPYSNVLKAGAFKLVGERFRLKKLDHHSHLYTSDEPVAEFPGKIFRVDKVLGWSKGELKQEIQKGGFYHLAVRNFPMSTNALRQQLQIKEGGDQSLFATTLQGKHILILCHLMD